MAAIGIVIVTCMGCALMNSTVDIGATQMLNSYRTGTLGSCCGILYWMLEPPRAVILTVVVSVIAACRCRDRWRGLACGAAIAFTWLPIAVMKVIFARRRPDASLLIHPVPQSPTDWSFPSGHTAFVVVLAVVVWMMTSSRVARLLVATVATIIPIAVLINGVHFPSDVLASVLWSLTIGPAVWQLSMWATDAIQRRRRHASL